MRSQRKYLVDVLLPEFSIHLVSGSSGARKSTWIFQFVQDWERGEPILGFTSYPVPWAYLSIDRTVSDAWEVLNTIKYNPPEEKIGSLPDLEAALTTGNVIKFMEQKLPHGGLLIAEGLQFLTPKHDNNQYCDVGMHLNALRREATKRNVTILGSVHNSKAKPGEEYLHPRDSIMGSVAWGATTGTLFAIKRIGGENSMDREMWICPRGAPEFKRQFQSINGRLIEIDQDESQMESLIADGFFSNKNAGDIITRAEFIEWAAINKISDRTVERQLTNRVKAGLLERAERGRYRIKHVN